MPSTINNLSSQVAGKVPTVAQLGRGIIALNHADGLLYLRDDQAISIVASISGTTLTVTSVAQGPVLIGHALAGAAAGTTVTGFGSGKGGAGTYSVSISQTVGSTTMTATLPTTAYLQTNTTGIQTSARLPVAQQGVSLQWNRNNGDGAAWLINQAGGGSGGIYFCKSDLNDNITQLVTIDSAGNLAVSGGLSVAGAISTTGLLTLNGGLNTSSITTGPITLAANSTGDFGPTNNNAQISIATAPNTNALISFNINGQLATKIGLSTSGFVIGGWSLPTNAFRIDGGGNAVASGAVYAGYGLANQLLLVGGNAGNSTSLLAQGSDANINISYASKGYGQHYFNSEVNIAPSGGYGLRLTANGGASPSTMLYSDGNAFYIMKTAANDPNGAFDSARPFAINLASGGVSMGNGLNVTGGATLDSVYINAPTAGDFGQANAGQLSLAAPNNGNAIITFNSAGSFAAKLGVNSAGFVIGGWSLPTNAFRIDAGGNAQASGAFFAGTGLANELIMSGNTAGNSVYLQAIGSDANVGIGYSTKGSGVHGFTGEIQGYSPTSQNQFRAIATGNSPAMIFRNDGNAFYLLKTPAATPYGGWDNTRPFSINLGNGLVTMSNGVTINGGLTASVQATGGTVYRNIADRWSERFSVKDFGAMGDGVTDDTYAIRVAINYVSSIGGGEIYVPVGNYVISDGISCVTSGVKFVGAGRGAFHDSAPNNPGTSRFIWNGPNGGWMFQFRPGSNSAQKLTDVGMTGIELVGTPGYTSGTSASVGLYIFSCQHSTFDLHTVEFANAAIVMSTTQCNEAANNEGNTLSLRFRQINTAGTALQLGGGPYGNTCFCHFPFIYGYINTGTGIDFQDCDNNTFGQVWIDSISNTAVGTPSQNRSLVFRGQTNSSGGFPTGGARVNTISHFSGSVHTNLIYSEGTESSNVTVPAYGNRIEYFDNSNAPINSQVGTGATFFWSGNKNATGTQDGNLDPNNGFVQMSNGLILFWGVSNGQYGAGSISTVPLPMACRTIISATSMPLGQQTSSANVLGYGGTSNYRTDPSNPATQQFDLYAPITGYYRWTGYALA